jgi:hypothetical protein
LRLAEASALDLLEVVDARGARQPMNRARFSRLARQAHKGFAITARDEAGALACVVGLWPEPDHVEAWLAVGPAFRRELRACLRLFERALPRMVEAAEVREVRAYVLGEGRVAGVRMAARLGLQETDAEATAFGPVRVFSRRYHGRHGQALLRRPHAGREAGGARGADRPAPAGA